MFKDIVNDENQHIDKHIITSLSEYDMKGFGIPAKDRQYILRDDAMKIYLDFQEKLFEYIKNPITMPSIHANHILQIGYFLIKSHFQAQHFLINCTIINRIYYFLQ